MTDRTPADQPYLEIRNLWKAFGDFVALRDVDLDLQPVFEPTCSFDITGVDFENSTAEPPPLKGVRRITQGLQGQTQFRFSCHCGPHSWPMCSG